MALMRSNVHVAIVTAAGYPGQAERFEQRVEGLLAAFRHLRLPAEVTDRFEHIPYSGFLIWLITRATLDSARDKIQGVPKGHLKLLHQWGKSGGIAAAPARFISTWAVCQSAKCGRLSLTNADEPSHAGQGICQVPHHGRVPDSPITHMCQDSQQGSAGSTSMGMC